MVLPAIMDLVVLFGPARLAVFLAAHGRLGVEHLGTLAILVQLCSRTAPPNSTKDNFMMKSGG